MSSKHPDPRLDRPAGGEAGGAPWPRPDCPPATDFERLILGTGSVEEREALIDHLAGCEGCSALVRDLRSLEGWAERVEREHRRRRPAAVRWALPIAAMLLLAVGGAAVWTQLGGLRPESGTHGIRGAGPEVTPASGSELKGPPERFTWPEQRGATGYRVRLFDGRGEPIWEGEWVTDTSCRAPDEVLGGAGGRQAFIWTVEPRGLGAGTQLGPFAFVIGGSGSPEAGGDR